MNIEQLIYLVEVAKSKSISTASEKLHVSQSGISKSITHLEKTLGIKIFKRSRLGTLPTTEGKRILEKAFEVVNKYYELQEEAQTQTSIINGTLKLSAIPTMFLTFLPKSLAAFKKDFPHVDIEITEKKSQDIIEDIKENKIDVGFVNVDNEIINATTSEFLDFETLVDGTVNAFVSKDSPLIYSDVVTPTRLINEQIVIYDSAYWKRFISKNFDQYGKVNILFTSNNTEVIKKTVTEGLSIGFLTDIALKNDRYVENGDIIPIPFEHHGPVKHSFGWIRSKKQHLSAAAREFLKYLKFQIRS